jgi:ABC-type multidrug transport system permease subunit
MSRVQRSNNLALLLAVSCFWFGCNTAAKELVKERIIFRRERDFNLRVLAYFHSKLLVLSVIGIIQATLLWGVVQLWCRLPGSALCEWLTLSALAVAGTAIGLLISAIARTEEFAVALVPIVVIPQIILSGVIAPLTGFAKWLANGLVTVHWGQRAIESLFPETDRKLLQMTNLAWHNSLAIILVHVAVAATLSVVLLFRTDDEAR